MATKKRMQRRGYGICNWESNHKINHLRPFGAVHISGPWVRIGGYVEDFGSRF
jgi:hypothetical protein